VPSNELSAEYCVWCVEPGVRSVVCGLSSGEC
jgi:hypothetical protein